MSENENTQELNERPDSSEREIANMDQFDFMTLLVESRIIQAS